MQFLLRQGCSWNVSVRQASRQRASRIATVKKEVAMRNGWEYKKSVRVSDSLYLTRTSQTVAATPSATDLVSLLQVGSLLVNSPTNCDSALSVEGPRRQGAVRIGQLDEAERRARTRPTTDRRYTADFPKNLQGLGLTLRLGDGKADTGPDLHGPAGIGGREDGSMGLVCFEDLT